MKPTGQTFEDALRNARLAEAAHLDALAKAQDAGALRLDFLRGLLLEQLPDASPLRASMFLRLPPEHAPRLLLDLSRSVAMGADGRTFTLQSDQDDHRSTAFTTSDAGAMASFILTQEAHGQIEAARKHAPLTVGASPLEPLTWGQLLYVWFTGMVTGAALLAIVYIYLKDKLL